jgi:hypothetical protein
MEYATSRESYPDIWPRITAARRMNVTQASVTGTDVTLIPIVGQ